MCVLCACRHAHDLELPICTRYLTLLITITICGCALPILVNLSRTFIEFRFNFFIITMCIHKFGYIFILTLYFKILLKYFIYLSSVILNKFHKRETARVLMINMGISKPHPRAIQPMFDLIPSSKTSKSLMLMVMLSKQVWFANYFSFDDLRTLSENLTKFYEHSLNCQPLLRC